MPVTDPTSLRLPARLLERLDAEAARQTRSRNNLVRVLLAEALDRLDAERAADAPRAVAACASR